MNLLICRHPSHGQLPGWLGNTQYVGSMTMHFCRWWTMDIIPNSLLDTAFKMKLHWLIVAYRPAMFDQVVMQRRHAKATRHFKNKTISTHYRQRENWVRNPYCFLLLLSLFWKPDAPHCSAITSIKMCKLVCSLEWMCYTSWSGIVTAWAWTSDFINTLDWTKKQVGG